MKVIKVYQKYHDAIVSLYLDELKHGMIMNMCVINHLTVRLSCARYHLIVIKRDLKDDTTLWHSKFKLLSFCPFIIQLVISNQEYFWKVLFLFIFMTIFKSGIICCGFKWNLTFKKSQFFTADPTFEGEFKHVGNQFYIQINSSS